ncbi:MAG: hypothetical protein GX289_11110 [Tissierellia bacterium]|nr:hypothetical protein [Tissierellia bacterium]
MIRKRKISVFVLVLLALIILFPLSASAREGWPIYRPDDRLPIEDYMDEYPDAILDDTEDSGNLQRYWDEGYYEYDEMWDHHVIRLYEPGETKRKGQVIATMLLKVDSDNPIEDIDYSKVYPPSSTFEKNHGFSYPSNLGFSTNSKIKITPISFYEQLDNGDVETIWIRNWDDLKSYMINNFDSYEELIIEGKPAIRVESMYELGVDSPDAPDGAGIGYSNSARYYIKMDELTPINTMILYLETNGSFYGSLEANTVTEVLEKIRQGDADLENKVKEYANWDYYYSIKLLEVDDSGMSVSKEVTTKADEDSGETDILIPAGIATVIIGGGVMIAKKRPAGKKSSGRKEEQDRQEKAEEEDQEENPNRYEMRIKKGFGNTISVGSKVIIYARIVEITPEGAENSRNDLTGKISISSSAYLKISGQTMAGEYKAAYVEAPDTGGEIPSEAKVSFRFAGSGSSFTNHVVFQIAEEKIVFGQDNLTLPSCYEKTERLPFAVFGMGDKAVVTAEIIRDDGYRVSVEPGEEKGLYYALITEKKKTKGQAGDYESYTLEVKAVNGDRSVTGTLPLYRFHMGLRLDLKSIGCYAEPYDPANHQSTKFIFNVDGKQYLPAESKATLTFLDWDPDSHSIIQIAPAVFDYQIEALNDEDQALLDKLAIQCQVMDQVTSGGRALIFRCCKGALDAPSRFKAKVKLSLNQGEEKYLLEKEVLLCSQPKRQSKNMEDAMAILKEDSRITERLQRIKSEIWNLNFLNKLFPLVKFIDVMLEGYHEDFGYDAKQLEIVKETWGGFLQGTVTGANADAKTVTLGDEMRLFIESYLQTAESIEESLGFMGRMALGVATLGCSDVVFTSLEVVREMKDYVEKGGESAWGAFFVGAKIVTVEYLSDYVMDTGLKIASNADVKQAMREMKDNAAESIQRFTTALKGKNAKAVISDSVQAGKAAAKKADLLLETGSKSVKRRPDQFELDEALRQGKQFAREQVENLQAAAWQFELNPTPANRKLLNDLTLKVQENKLAMYALQDYADEGLDSARKAFNETLSSFYQNADPIAKSKLSSITGIPADRIQVLNASSSSQKLMKQGKRTTIDRDWTAYYVNSKGEKVYFNQAMTEQIYNDSFYESALGYKNKDASFSNRHALKKDQTVIEDIIGHRESYGKDLDKMLDKNLHHMALDNPDKVAATISEKGKEWFQRSDDLLVKAREVADPSDRMLMMADAIGQKMEGYRQLTKQFENCICPRDIARRANAEASKIPERIRVAVSMCNQMMFKDSHVTLTCLEDSLQALGFTPDSLADALGDLIKQIG